MSDGAALLAVLTLALGFGAGWLIGRRSMARSVAQRLRSMAVHLEGELRPTGELDVLHVRASDTVGVSDAVHVEVGPKVVTLPEAEFQALLDELAGLRHKVRRNVPQPLPEHLLLKFDEYMRLKASGAKWSELERWCTAHNLVLRTVEGWQRNPAKLAQLEEHRSGRHTLP